VCVRTKSNMVDLVRDVGLDRLQRKRRRRTGRFAFA